MKGPHSHVRAHSYYTEMPLSHHLWGGGQHSRALLHRKPHVRLPWVSMTSSGSLELRDLPIFHIHFHTRVRARLPLGSHASLGTHCALRPHDFTQSHSSRMHKRYLAYRFWGGRQDSRDFFRLLCSHLTFTPLFTPRVHTSCSHLVFTPRVHTSCSLHVFTSPFRHLHSLWSFRALSRALFRTFCPEPNVSSVCRFVRVLCPRNSLVPD